MRKLSLLLWLFPCVCLAQESGLALDETFAIASLDEGIRPVLEEMPEPPKKIPDAALGLSLGLTSLALVVGGELSGVGNNADIAPLRIAGISVLAAGVALFPSAGHLYAQDFKRAKLGIGLRSGAILVGGSLLLAAASRPEAEALNTIAFSAAGLMGAVTLVDAALDIADSEEAVRRANKKALTPEE